MPGHKDEPITLAQFLKVVQVADTGGQAKVLVREGRASVNGEPDNRPGRKLAEGDVVTIDGKTFTVATRGSRFSGPPVGQEPVSEVVTPRPRRQPRSGPPRMSQRGPPRDDRPEPPREERRGPPPRDDMGGMPRDGRRRPRPSDDHDGPFRDDRRGPPRRGR